jgi:hypothetical protein
MKQRLFMRNRRGETKRSIGISLAIIMTMSTLLGFATQIAAPEQAQAAAKPDITREKEVERRTYLNFRDCLLNQVDFDGKARDGNNRNIEFENYDELWKSNKEVIVVGLDIDDNNGVRSCKVITSRALSLYKPDVQGQEAFMMRTLWGKTIDENGGAIKVGNGNGELKPATVRANARELADIMLRRAESISNQYDMKKYTLGRLKPLLTRCYKDWSSKLNNTKLYKDPEDINSPKRELYANARDFEAKEVPYIKTNDGAGSLTNSEIGDIELAFLPGQVNSEFNSRKSDWYPIGNDLGEKFLGSYYRDHRNQTFLDCEWINKNADYLFKRSASNHYYFRPKAGSVVIVQNSGTGSSEEGDVEENESEVQDAPVISEGGPTDGGDSAGYQCVVTPPLSWIACPIITLMVDALDKLEGAIVSSLEVPPLTTDGPFEDLHTTWKAFRDIANAFLVLIFLITIFAQVLPIEVDPYMVKKVLPRIIAAAILIQFSYFIIQIMFDISRVLGEGVRTILTSIPVPESGSGIFGTNVESVTATSTFASLGAVAVGGAGVAAAFSAGTALIVPLLLILLSALISVITLFVTLQVRMIVIIMFTIIAPLAFLAWILPNTESYFKKWGSSLVKLLLMYPIIVFMVEGANMITNISYSAVSAMTGTDEGVTEISKLMISIVPIVIFFMIPATFKWAGGIFATISSAVQGQGSRMSKRVRSGALMKNSLQDAKDKAATKLYETEGTKGFRRLGARVATGNAFSFGGSGRRKIRKTQDEAYAKVSELLQDEYRNDSNAEVLTALNTKKASKKGLKKVEEMAMLDLMASRGGALELADYFAGLESGPITTHADGSYTQGKVTRNANGSIKKIDDEAWSQLTKKHSAYLAQMLPHTTGKAMSAQDGNSLIKAKGKHPAAELEREVDKLVAAGDTTAVAALMEQFYSASQKDDASSMDKAMVATFQNIVANHSMAAGVTFNLSDGSTIDAATLVANQTKNGRLTKFVQPS